MQNLIVAILFIGAVYYLFRIFRKAFSLKEGTGCSESCAGACGTLDMEKLVKKIEEQEKN